jgi:hypothetical protein
MQWRPNVATPLASPQANFHLHKQAPSPYAGIGGGKASMVLAHSRCRGAPAGELTRCLPNLSSCIALHTHWVDLLTLP